MTLPRRTSALALAAALTLASACNSGSETSTSSGSGGDSSTSVAGGPASSPAPPATEPGTTTTVDPGTLPQTEDRPSATDPRLREHGALLWEAIVQDDPSIALPFFFPEAAYLQVKQISDPAKDYKNRLIAYYEQDIHALHKQLGANAETARFEGIQVNEANAQWIKPGVEYNKGSYWRAMYNQLKYSVNGKQQSLPLVSMISWRGQWYVVHLSSIR